MEDPSTSTSGGGDTVTPGDVSDARSTSSDEVSVTKSDVVSEDVEQSEEGVSEGGSEVDRADPMVVLQERRHRELTVELRDVAARGLCPRRMRQLRRLFLDAEHGPGGPGGQEEVVDSGDTLSDTVSEQGSSQDEVEVEDEERREVAQLNERRLVSNILESIDARQRLERAVRVMVQTSLEVVNEEPPRETDGYEQLPRDVWRPVSPSGSSAETIADVVELFERHLVTAALTGPVGQRLTHHLDSRHHQGPHDIATHLAPGGAPAPHHQVAQPVTRGGSRWEGGEGSVVRGLRQEMADMRHLVSMMYDMQVELHRMVRQEVAAGGRWAVPGVQQGSAGSPQYNNTPPVVMSAVPHSGQCLICLDRPSCAVFYQCGHLCTCLQCALRLKTSPGSCPVCRAPIRDVIRCYGVSN